MRPARLGSVVRHAAQLAAACLFVASAAQAQSGVDLAAVQRECVAAAPGAVATASCIAERLGSEQDPSVQLYVLAAQQLADDVKARRTTEPAARVALQRALLEAIASQREAAWAAAEHEERVLAASRAEYEAQQAERARAL